MERNKIYVVPNPIRGSLKKIEKEHGIGVDIGWGNGYVAIPPSHPLYKRGYNDMIEVKNIDDIKFNDNYIGLLINSFDPDRKENQISIDLLVHVHGGITYANSAKVFKNPLWPGHTFLKLKEKPLPDDWWVFGFDTAHAGDTLKSGLSGRYCKRHNTCLMH